MLTPWAHVHARFTPNAAHAHAPANSCATLARRRNSSSACSPERSSRIGRFERCAERGSGLTRRRLAAGHCKCISDGCAPCCACAPGSCGETRTGACGRGRAAKRERCAAGHPPAAAPMNDPLAPLAPLSAQAPAMLPAPATSADAAEQTPAAPLPQPAFPPVGGPPGELASTIVRRAANVPVVATGSFPRACARACAGQPAPRCAGAIARVGLGAPGRAGAPLKLLPRSP